jgi:hypothetical protein
MHAYIAGVLLLDIIQHFNPTFTSQKKGSPSCMAFASGGALYFQDNTGHMYHVSHIIITRKD